MIVAVTNYKKDDSPEYAVLKKGQGIMTRLRHLNTSSLEALDKIIEDRKQEIHKSSNKPK